MSGETPYIISQRSMAGGPAFRFNEHHLDYFGTDWDFRAKYEDIAGPSQHRRSKTSDRPTSFVFGYLMCLGVVLLSRGHYPQYGLEGLRAVGTFAGIFTGIVVVICSAMHYLAHKEYTMIPTRNGHLMVVKDKRHDAILHALQAARLKSLRALSAPDPANSSKEELAKLIWLRDEGAITTDEYTHLSARLSAE
jgi:hypothetical protein